MKITKVVSREVLDSRGYPTVEADVHLDSGHWGRAISPSGASTGVHEALELRDNDPTRYLGKGVLKAVQNVNESLAKVALGKDPSDLKHFDMALIEADGSENKTRLGANAILAVSLAAAKAAACAHKMNFAQWIHQKTKDMGYSCTPQMPIPLMNVINGGAHADNGLDIQEFMIVPHGFSTFKEAIRAGCETFHHLKKLLSSKGLVTAVGDEGGFAPRLKNNEEALSLICQAIEKTSYKLGSQISVALDVASSEFYKEGVYQFKDTSVGTANTEKIISFYEDLKKKFPLVSIEDAFAEDDWNSWVAGTSKLGSKVQLIGDDLFVTQKKRLASGIEKNAANAILIKLNQVGSLYETLETMKLATEKGYRSISSHRSGESEDTSLAHLAVATGCGQVKTGSASRSDRMAKYNELLRLEEEMNLGLAVAPWK